MKELKRVRRNMFSRQIFTITIIFALLSTLFYFQQSSNHVSAAANVPGSSISLTTPGTAYTENFDTLSNTAASGITPAGWGFIETGSNADTNYGVGAGASNAGDTYSFGASGNTDRAFGGLQSGSLVPTIGACYTNNTGGVITSLAISYTGEEWRLGTAGRADQIDFQYSTNATALNSGTWTDVDALDFSTPGTTTAGAKDGNAAANRTAINSTITGLNIPNGATFFIRWTDFNASGSDDGLAVDDFSLTPNGTGSGGSPTLSINNVSVIEGNSGTTMATFTIGLSSAAGAGGVTFDIATQDNTAIAADNDYVVKSLPGQTIAAGNSSYTFDVTVNGDTNVEPNETFFVNVTNVTGATPMSVQGTGTIINDETTQINQIQGSGSTSPLAGQSVTTGGIVTATKNNGFFLQTPDAGIDADPNTSEGIFVFTASAPPAAAAIGNFVNISGTVSEFVPSSAPNQPPVTEIVSPTVASISTGNPLPAPITITAADTTPNNLENLERFEGMRVRINSLTVVAPTQGSINEPNATVSSNGLFFGVVTGVARPLREPGIDLSINPPAGAPANVPRFDTNPERLRIDSDAQPGALQLNVAAGEIVSNITGPLDYAFVTWSIYPDAATPPTVSNLKSTIPAPQATADEFTVSSFNMQRFFDTTDAPGISDPVLTTTAFNNRLNKASLVIRNVMRSPDVIGVEEMENLTTLQTVATKVNNDAVAASQPNPNYQAYLIEGNDVGGIDVGFLVKSSRVNVVDVTQVGKNATFIDPNTGSPTLLNDRPPLVLRASIQPAVGAPVAFTVIVNHLRSLSSVDDPVDGNRVRTKRRAQAEYLASLIQGRQTSDPNERIISIGDYNAFQFNDGYVDSIGTIKGDPTPADQVVLASGDLVNPNLTDLLDFLPPTERYSFIFDGNAQVLDHELVNSKMLEIFNRIAYARNNAGFPQTYYQDSSRPERISDHDIAVAYFSLTGTGISGQGIEGDVASRLNGNGAIESNDVIQMLRFLNELDLPGTSTNEFQRADSAPRATSGDGSINSADVIQTVRYLNELDGTQFANGPIASSDNIPSASADAKGFGEKVSKSKQSGKVSTPQVAPELRVENASGSAGNPVTVNIRVDAVGNESQYAFAVLFDPAVLTFSNFAAGETGAADFSCNTTATPGRVRCSVGAFPTNNPMSNNATIKEINAGNNQLLIKVIFNVAANAMANSTTAISIGSQTAADDLAASIIPAATSGTVSITGTTAAGATVGGRVQNGAGRGVANARVVMISSRGERVEVRTNGFGYYRFGEVRSGESYTMTVESKQYRFAPRVVNVTQDLDNVNFIAQAR